MSFKIFMDNILCNSKKQIIYIQVHLVSALLGKSHFNKTIDSFIRILNINAHGMFDTHGEYNNENTFKQYLDKFNLPHSNVYEVRNALESIKTMDIPLNVREKIKKYIICSFGKKHEKTIIQKYIKDLKYSCNRSMCSKQIFDCKYFSIILNGTPDYIDSNNTFISEVKNRIHSLTKTIKECDRIQLQIYLNMFEIENGNLIEGMILDNDKIATNVYELKRDKEEYKLICCNIIKPCILIYKLLNDKSLRLYFESLSKLEKNIFINNNFELIEIHISRHIIELDNSNIDETSGMIRDCEPIAN